jgi:glycosyltransferase involved in cell wall biosynthesis
MLVAQPDISVVMATYNGEQYLRAQLNSILSQTIPPKEIIVVDDASSDTTVEIVKSYAANDNRFRLFINEQNIGYIRSFEKGMLAADATLIALSDQDDIWMSHKLETLVTQMGSSIAVYSDSILVDATGATIGKKMSDIKNQLTYNNCLMYTIGAWAPGHAMLFRKELVEKCKPFPTIVTHDFWLGFIASCNGGIKYVNEVLVQYRQHTANAIGANTRQSKKQQPTTADKINTAQKRMQLLYENCPASLTEQKQVFETLSLTYQRNDFMSRWKRMITFFRYRNIILAYKKKSALMRVLFCVKMFFKIDA